MHEVCSVECEEEENQDSSLRVPIDATMSDTEGIQSKNSPVRGCDGGGVLFRIPVRYEIGSRKFSLSNRFISLKAYEMPKHSQRFA